MHNSVLALRQRELVKSTRPFLARGGKVIRCEACLLPAQNCICAHVPAPQADCAFVLLMFKGECYKPTNTGRLIADVAKHNFAFTWHRTEPDPDFLALIDDPQYQPIIVFPHDYAEPHRCIHQVPATGKIPLFIMLDGTWREARKMFKKSEYLQTIPVMGIKPQSQSDYKLREAAHGYQLCTAEVGVEVLKVAGEPQAAATLAHYFKVFRHHYVKGKPHLTDTHTSADLGL
ncbi:tRNA-uridine aminocarboxypropyltransferase [Alteromonas gilva]|uniref:tRNA-uridine aminocarboxypropyltransferase n=1 Tax=Alteromonas gilva TaxID=2987522 RepID=A0ABT5KYH1_9ALTE|nr:tRNA-uridine aminocarboxypropyltransferase [Alteromonas gilva]MDC8829678.1 DTW domain-containing protein [Alteromonas gilva]